MFLSNIVDNNSTVREAGHAMISSLSKNEMKWTRYIWLSYWGIIALHAAAQLFAYWFLSYSAHPVEFYVLMLLHPTLVMAGAVLGARIAVSISERCTFYALVTAGTVLAYTIILLNTDIRMISAIFLLPLLSSILFFRVRLTLFAAALQLAAFVLLYARSRSYRQHLTDFDLIAIPCFIAVCTVMAVLIMVRGRELHRELRESMIAQQALTTQFAAIREQAEKDALTGLYNQAQFRTHFQAALDYAAAGERRAFQLVLLDIDHFKSINDTFGHRAGDAVLAETAAVIERHMPASGIAARYGGEEFALLLFEPSESQAYAVCEAIRLGVAQTPFDALDGKGVTISAGIASFGEAGGEGELFDLADNRLYQAKRQGRNRTVRG